MRYRDVALLEMNVSNVDNLKSEFVAMLTAILQHRQCQLPPPLYDLIVKRAVKAMQNDDAGNMTTRQMVAAAGSRLA